MQEHDWKRWLERLRELSPRQAARCPYGETPDTAELQSVNSPAQVW